MKKANLALPHLGAFESTKLMGSRSDILGTTRHIQQWHLDLSLLREAGISQLRYSAPWHRIERRPGVFDWRWMDQPMRFFESTGMDPIIDPLHHISFPDWLDQGFAHPEFPVLYERFVLAFQARYPFVKRYTIFNEPLPTTLFCSLTGMWYPHGTTDQEFVRMAINVGRAICRTSAAMRRANSGVRFIHVDTCEFHQAHDVASESWVEFANHRRFLMHDLVLGRIGTDHPLYLYLVENGADGDELRWFKDNPTPIDILGLDYYSHCEMEWKFSTVKRRPDIWKSPVHALGFASIAREYEQRFQLPIMLTETNLRGTICERLTWLKFMEEQCEMLLSTGSDLRGFCWYPSIDSTDWCHQCTKATRTVDPQGIWWLDRKRVHRHASELSQTYAQLAQGLLTSADIPAYRFSRSLQTKLRGHVKLMRHWTKWLDQRPRRIAA